MRRSIVLVMAVLLTAEAHLFANEEPAQKADASTKQKSKNDPVKETLDGEKKKRISELDQLVKQVASGKLKLKQAVISDDATEIAKQRQVVNDRQQEINKVMDAPFEFPQLDLFHFQEGQVGSIASPMLHVLQIVNKDKGAVLVHSPRGNRNIMFKAVGLSSKNLVDDMKFPPGTYVVVGTYAYETVSGAERTIFEIQLISPESLFTANEVKAFREHASPDFEIKLTPEEEKTRLLNREEAKKKMAQKDVEAKTRRAKSFLESGKLLLKKDNPAGAKKQFEKCIAEDPNSEAAKEAEKLLEKLP